MKKEFFNEFPALWDGFECLLRREIVTWIMKKNKEKAGADGKKLSSIYFNTGFDYWVSGAGAQWRKQLDEVFFESRYYKNIKLLEQFDSLDMQVAQRMEGLNTTDAQKVYNLAVKPVLENRKQYVMNAFVEMAVELDEPFPYVWKLPVDGQETALTLGFQNRYKKQKRGGMDGYTYSFNGRIYKDIQAFTTPTIEKLSTNVSIAKDTFGEMVLRRYTEIPTFDSGDREWDSAEIEYLLYDSKDVHLIVIRGGYSIAHLIFFEKLLTADSRMKPVFEKLGWSMDNVEWISPRTILPYK